MEHQELVREIIGDGLRRVIIEQSHGGNYFQWNPRQQRYTVYSGRRVATSQVFHHFLFFDNPCLPCGALGHCPLECTVV